MTLVVSTGVSSSRAGEGALRPLPSRQVCCASSELAQLRFHDRDLLLRQAELECLVADRDGDPAIVQLAVVIWANGDDVR